MVTGDKFLPTKTSKVRIFILIGQVIGIYILDNSPITSFISFGLYSNVIKPLLWCGVVFTVWYFPRLRPQSRLKHRSIINWWSFYFAIIYIVVSVLVGIFIEGLGKSPYSHSLTGILLNIITVGTALVGRELVRGYLVNNKVKESFLMFLLITSFMTITNLSLRSFTYFTGYQNLVEYLAEYFAPEFVENLLATYLVFLGGPIASITYLGIVKGFHWLSPILPNLQWITKALIGVLCPMFFLMLIKRTYMKISKQLKQSEKDEESPLSWMITSVISIGIIWFAVGVFPIYPSVIATGSMEPMINPGDVILVQKIVDMDGIDNLKIGDIILFKKDSIQISHRIIDITEDENGKRFKTKGDNNSGEDQELVQPENIRGKVVYSIPKVGFLTLLIKSKDDIPIEEIVY